MSEVQHEFLTSMTNKSCDHRPFLEEILKHCSYYFESQSQASEEVDKLVSYVLGPTLEVRIIIIACHSIIILC